MFDHLIFILEHANILLGRPSLRGSTPLDVAYSSLMDNTELALALREQHLEKIAAYLSRCGLTGNTELMSRRYPDLGWVKKTFITIYYYFSFPDCIIMVTLAPALTEQGLIKEHLSTYSLGLMLYINVQFPS